MGEISISILLYDCFLFSSFTTFAGLYYLPDTYEVGREKRRRQLKPVVSMIGREKEPASPSLGQLSQKFRLGYLITLKLLTFRYDVFGFVRILLLQA